VNKPVIIGDATLYLGDCLEILPHLPKVEVVITDPVWPNCPAGLLPGSDRPWQLFSETCRLLNPTRMVIVMRHDSDPRFLAPVPLPYVRAVWLPYVMPGYIGRLLGGDEIAYCFGEPIPSAPGQRVIPGRAEPQQPSGRKANGHPCSRALGHFDFITRWWSQPGETILDPMMGSGTTLEAAMRAGRPSIGIEIHEPYFDIACRRIEDAYRQGKLFEEPKPEQLEINAMGRREQPPSHRGRALPDMKIPRSHPADPETLTNRARIVEVEDANGLGEFPAGKAEGE
jgi:hypothetical protein